MVAIKLDLEDYGPVIKLIKRDEWGALPAQTSDAGVATLTQLELPVFFVKLTQTGGYDCEGTMQCNRVMQDLQAEHIYGGATDIHYNFLITGYSTVYEGRGWTRGAHRPNVGDSTTCIDIAYVGKYDKDKKPPWDMVSTAIDFIKYSLRHKCISHQFRIV